MKTPCMSIVAALTYAALQVCAFSYVADSKELPHGTVSPATYHGWHYVERYFGPVWLGHAAGAAVSISVDEGCSTAWTLPYMSYENVTIPQTSGTATGRYHWWTETKEIIKELIPMLPELMPTFMMGV